MCVGGEGGGGWGGSMWRNVCGVSIKSLPKNKYIYNACARHVECMSIYSMKDYFHWRRKRGGGGGGGRGGLQPP